MAWWQASPGSVRRQQVLADAQQSNQAFATDGRLQAGSVVIFFPAEHAKCEDLRSQSKLQQEVSKQAPPNPFTNA